MFFKGLIRGFRRYDSVQLEKMREDLALSMPLPKLAFCASYYRERAKRDPYIEEIVFLDTFCHEASPSPLSVAPIELSTNDEFVAKTYADLLQKRRAMAPDVKRPTTLSEAFGVAGAYLGRVGKPVALPCSWHALEDRDALPGMENDENVIALPEARFALRRLPYDHRVAPTDELLVLLLPDQTLDQGAYAEAFRGFLNDPGATACIRQYREVGMRGILYDVLQMTHGALIDLARLTRTGETAKLAALCELYRGYKLLRIAKQSLAELQKNSSLYGLRALDFARIEHKDVISIADGGKLEIVWNTDFLQRIFDLYPVSVKLQDEADGENASILHHLHRRGSSRYLKARDLSPLETDTCGDTVYAAAHSEPTGAYFRNALDTALAAVLTLAASGVDYTEQRLAATLNLPTPANDPEIAAAATSALLGLYRLQAELALPLTVGRVDASESAKVPEITAFAMANGAAGRHSLRAANNQVYCLVPQLDANGLPRFAELRAFLLELAAKARQGLFKSFYVLCRESVNDAAKKMNTDRLACRVRDTVFFDPDPLPLAVLVETEQPLDAMQVGRVVERACAPTPAAILPEEKLKLEKEAHTVLLADPHDTDAHALALQLSARGARVTTVDPKNVSSFAHALLDATALIVCGRVTIPSDTISVFALRALSERNVPLLLVGDAEKPGYLSAFICRDNLSEKLLDQLCLRA